MKGRTLNGVRFFCFGEKMGVRVEKPVGRFGTFERYGDSSLRSE